MNRNWLLTIALFLSLTAATFFSVQLQLSSRIQERQQVDAEYVLALERKEELWAEMEMERYKQVHGFLPVRLEPVNAHVNVEQPAPQTESNLRGSTSAY
jgi:hypothetical protein